MAKLPKKLAQKLDKRRQDGALRELCVIPNLVDFSSNDYLGFAQNEIISGNISDFLKNSSQVNGSTGSRLLTGNHHLYTELESFLERFYTAEAALVFNSGYDANIGFFSSVPQRGDIILFDELVHASIRDGIRLSDAKSYKFAHNDVEDLDKKMQSVRRQSKGDDSQIYVVTESIFSMDGDSPDLEKFSNYCKDNALQLIVDEAHAVGVFGNGKGLLPQLELQNQIFARIVTFGKALGCHGAAVLCDGTLKTYLVNFARSFIYTTALPPHTVGCILGAHRFLESKEGRSLIAGLHENIAFFKETISSLGLQPLFLSSDSAIQVVVLKGNQKVKECAQLLQNKQFDVRPILTPTVPKGNERLRICLHAFNTKKEIGEMLNLISKYSHE
ncbi:MULTISPECIES: 8-amino-7-oxononanoate synthase [Flavobacteriaceae]|uniref:aminotransferase class I/II-fold pyridoxal phosphate-dependent enzyme n=1 Tax=Flavobacteriaceae TaxID=49546 RepID=UPI001492DF35|nr:MULTISPECIES: 8-amino-7-oxononanoate synthase [Allomuricauda]MDC6365379.1 8-amino-7-oxononanoate synthase [Muricauda sp. AC10]